MRLDIQKLDERINKLQEIRRMLADPETAAILLDLISTEDGRAEPLHQSPVETHAVETHAAPMGLDVNEVLKEVAAAGESQSSGGLWGIRRK